MFEKIFREIQAELNTKADEEYRILVRDHFKMDVSNFLGVRIPLVRKIANKYFKELKGLRIEDILKFCNQLLETKIYEHKVIAFHWSFKCSNQYQNEHFKVFESWLKTYVDDWSDCDDLCTHTLGYFVYQYPEFLSKVKLWASSKNRWVKRASAVTLIYSVKRGRHLDSVFEVASELLLDKDDLVQKGYGWILKETSNSFPQEVLEFVMNNKNEMPRTALRYAIEKLPPKQKRAAMQKP